MLTEFVTADTYGVRDLAALQEWLCFFELQISISEVRHLK